MDPSALIFVALAVAWAVYLIPKALEHHEEGLRSRTVDRFSASMRVLARREPTSRRRASLVVPGPARPAVEPEEVRPLTPAQRRVRRAAAARAARRRLRVLTFIVLVLLVVGILAASEVLAWVWIVAPVVVLLAWLMACRLMVRREHAELATSNRPARPAQPKPARTNTEPSDAELAEVFTRRPADPDATETISAVSPGDEPYRHETTDASGQAVAGDDVPQAGSGSWDPVPVTLPTYVSKPAAARRSVRTIDLDSTGVWTSGRSEIDSEIVRRDEAAKAEASAETKRGDESRRATGS